MGPEVVSSGEPEETGPRRAQAGRCLEDPRSPSTERASPNSIDNVPTPLKPRSWDPHRNIAYTPPMENLDNNSTPEVSPERKARLLVSSDRVSTCCNLSTHGLSPKDTLDRTEPLRRNTPEVSPERESRLLMSADRISACNISANGPSPKDALDRTLPFRRSTPEVSPGRKARLFLSSDRISTCNLTTNGPLKDCLDRTLPLRRSTPEVSPGRRARLVVSSERVSTCNLATNGLSPKDCLDRTQPLRRPLSRLSPPAPPPSAPTRRFGGSVVTRPIPAWESPARGTADVAAHASTSTLRCQPRLDHHAANVLLRKLHSCNEQLRQIQSAMLYPEHGLQGLDSVHENAYRGDVVGVVDSSAIPDDEKIAGGQDVLTASAPPLVGAATPGVLQPRVLDVSARITVEGVTSARGRENILPPNPVAVGCTYPAKPWKGTPTLRNGVVCYTSTTLYATPTSPLKVSTTPVQGHQPAGQQPSPATAPSRVSNSGLQQQQQPQPQQQQPPQAAVWTQLGSSTIATARPSGTARRRASVAGHWVQACEQR